MSDAVEIRALDEANAGALVACVRRCYGDTYPDGDFLDAARIRAGLRSGRLSGRVAVTAQGRVVGHVGIRFETAGDCVADTVAGVVDPAFRGRHLLRELGGRLYRDFRARPLAGVRNYATCAHVRTQRMIEGGGGHRTGLLLAEIPAGTHYRGIEREPAAERIAAVVYYQPFGAAPALRVSLPERWQDEIASIYREIGLERERRPEARRETPGAALELDPRRRIARIRVGAGANALPDLLDRIPAADVDVVHADLPLAAGAGSGSAAEILAERGFVFGALLPGSEVSERLRLQRVAGAHLAPERIELASPDSRALLQRILAEQALAQPQA